jgi:very-long-chain (3R)-3-hydroxyacyl-CoA dehydratase
MIFQTLAALEVLHCILRLVRSNVMLTAFQVMSRLILVWYVCYMSVASQMSIGVTMMLIAWSVTEIIRYSYYSFSILGIEVGFLQWLR